MAWKFGLVKYCSLPRQVHSLKSNIYIIYVYIYIYIYYIPEKSWNMVVERLLSFWEGVISVAMLGSGRVHTYLSMQSWGYIQQKCNLTWKICSSKYLEVPSVNPMVAWVMLVMSPSNLRSPFKEMDSDLGCTPRIVWTIINMNQLHTVDGWNPAPVVYHIPLFTGLYTSQAVSCISSICPDRKVSGWWFLDPSCQKQITSQTWQKTIHGLTSIHGRTPWLISMGVATCWDESHPQTEMVAPFQGHTFHPWNRGSSTRRDIHGATAAYYARHAGITSEFLMRHDEGKKRKTPWFF